MPSPDAVAAIIAVAELDRLRLEVAALRVAVAGLRTLVVHQAQLSGQTPTRWLVAPPSTTPGPYPPGNVHPYPSPTQ